MRVPTGRMWRPGPGARVEGAPQGAAGPRRPGEAGSVHPAEDERGHHTV